MRRELRELLICGRRRDTGVSTRRGLDPKAATARDSSRPQAHHEGVEGPFLVRPDVVELENATVGGDAEDQALHGKEPPLANTPTYGTTWLHDKARRRAVGKSQSISATG